MSELLTYGINDKSSGWSAPQDTLYPWNGYAVYSAERSFIYILPFPGDDLVPRTTLTNEWYLGIEIKTENKINYASEIGRRQSASDVDDIFDMIEQEFPDL